MNYIARRLFSLVFLGCASIAGLFFIPGPIGIPTTQAQSTVDSIKIRIRTVVSSVDGKITSATKTRLIEIISSRIRASTNAVITDIYVFFLREVKKLRTSDQVIPISTTSSNTNSSTTTSSTSTVGPDFAVTFAAISASVQLDQKFATLNIKFKNLGTVYNSDGLGSLKFGCKGVDGTVYPYRSFLESAPPIPTNGEVVMEVPSVYIGNLTSNKGFKLLECKIDSSDLVNESNELNNSVNIGVQVN